MKRSVAFAVLAIVLVLLPSFARADTATKNYHKTTSTPEGKATCVFVLTVNNAAGKELTFTVMPGAVDPATGENGGEIRLRDPMRLVSAGHENACDIWSDNRPSRTMIVKGNPAEYPVVFQLHSHPDNSCHAPGVAFGKIQMSIPNTPDGTLSTTASNCDTNEANGNLFIDPIQLVQTTRTGRRVPLVAEVHNFGPGALLEGSLVTRLPSAAAWIEAATINGNPCDIGTVTNGTVFHEVTCDLGNLPPDGMGRFEMSLIPRRVGKFNTTLTVEGANNGGLFTPTLTHSTNVQQGVTRTLSLTVKGRNGGGGTVNINPPGTNCTHPDAGNPGATKTQCFEFYADGAPVTLTANPQAGSGVTWSGACTGTAATCNLTMDSDKVVEARFAP